VAACWAASDTTNGPHPLAASINTAIRIDSAASMRLT
jgi:hypothetical protein